MPRPQPEVVATQEYDDIIYDILKTTGVYSLCYQGRPVSLRETRWREDGGNFWEYPKTCFNAPGYCESLAEKLNLKFNTQDFTCEHVADDSVKSMFDKHFESAYNRKRLKKRMWAERELRKKK